MDRPRRMVSLKEYLGQVKYLRNLVPEPVYIKRKDINREEFYEAFE
jgi:predicted secreted protein